MPDLSRVFGCLLLASLVAACSPRHRAGEDAPARAATRDSAAPGAEAAADQLRDRLYAFDPAACVREAEALRQRHPTSGRLRAWHIACVAAVGRVLEAEALAEAMLAERPDDPWAEFARVAVGILDPSAPRPAAVLAGDRLVRLLAEHPDALQLRDRGLLAYDRTDEVLAHALSHAELRTSRLRALFQASRQDAGRLPEALAEAEQARGVAAIDAAEAAAAALFAAGRFAEAKAWSDRALAASPASVQLRQQRWQLLRKLPELDDEARRAAVVADIDALLALRDDQPPALLAAAEVLRELGVDDRAEALETRLLEQFADSPAAESLLYTRIAGELGPDGEPRPERRAEARALVDAFLARPQLHSPDLRERVGGLRLGLLRDDPQSPPDELLAAIEFMVVAGRSDIESAHAFGPIELARRGAHLQRAEALARAGLGEVARVDAELRASGLPPDICEMFRRDRLGIAHDALGAVLLARGRVDEAEAALKESQAVSPGYAESLARLAQVARTRGDFAAAEAHLLAGYDQELGRDNPCKAMLAELYREQHGGMQGFDKYVDGIKARAREARRAGVLAKKIAAPRPVPAFALTRLDGSKVTSDDLRGKIVVIKFWFTTCKPCIDELPEFEQLVADYARDRDVEILTIHNDGDTKELTAWMAERGHRFPVLLDGDYCEQAGVVAFPTFWVLDRDGRIAYDHSGAAGHLREEYGWRIESLRG